MLSTRFASACTASLVCLASPANAEFQCAPAGKPSALAVEDVFYAEEAAAWSQTTKRRYLEGNAKNCSDVRAVDYDGYPTKRCVYKSVDAGSAHFKALEAQVVLLNPSSGQLASWSVRACRTNGATDATMRTCLVKLRKHIMKANGAQFPIAGSVVESKCNSSPEFPNGCNDLSETHAARAPRNTWFRHGVSVDYKTQDIRWSAIEYKNALFEKVFDTIESDKSLGQTFTFSRVSGATRDDWKSWRKNGGKPQLTDGSNGSVDGRGWQIVSRDVHKAACQSASNELFDAIVYARGWAQSR